MALRQIDHARLEVVEQGRGPTLVFVHGSASDLRTWDGQRAAFARRYRVVAYSRRHHWPNAPIPAGADYSMREHLDDLRDLVGSLGAGPVHLVGHSYGAFLALLLAIEAPDRVRTLALAEPPVLTLFVSAVPRPAEVLRLLATRPRTGLALLGFGAFGFAPARAAARRGDLDAAMRAFGRAVLGGDAFRRLSDARREQARANLFAAEFLGSGLLPLDAQRLRGVRAPTLLVEGQRSPALFHRLGDALAECLPDVRRVEIAGASHLVHEDAPVAYRDAVLSFLAERSTA